jgi:hypothetical protein
VTPAQKEALRLIRENGGYACLYWHSPTRWCCASLGPHSFQADGPELSARVMNRLEQMGVIQLAPGHGYGCKSFWEIVE